MRPYTVSLRGPQSVIGFSASLSVFYTLSIPEETHPVKEVVAASVVFAGLPPQTWAQA